MWGKKGQNYEKKDCVLWSRMTRLRTETLTDLVNTKSIGVCPTELEMDLQKAGISDLKMAPEM